jgi:hypothetical protein
MKLRFSSKKVETEFFETPRKICIAAHTVPFLDIFTIYYSSTFWRELDTKIYVSENSYYLPFFFSWCIRVKRGGFVQQEVERLSRLLEFCHILFPSGGTITWKTGFYILARETGAKIVILGIDYWNGEIVVDSILTLSPISKSFQEIKEIAIQQLRTYPVRYECMFFLQSLGIPYGDETFPISKRSKRTKQSIWIARGLFFLCLFYFFTYYKQ